MECIAAGFDVGNLNSHIAMIYRDGRVEIVSNEYGDRKTPTYVTFAGKLRLVGTAAVLQDTITAKSFGDFLPLLGRRVDDVPEDQWKHFNKKITTLNEDERIKIKMEFNNMEWEITPEQLLAMQLIKLKQNSRMHSDNSDIPVGISVPCYLTDPERRAVLDAAKVADLRNVTLINHVDALCSYYMVYNKKLPERNKPVKNVAFVSMGYTGTEVAICGFQKGVVEIQSVEYDANLGGRNFDQAIFEELTAEFEKANGVKVCDNSNNHATVSQIDRHSKRAERIRRECANLKVKLSANKVSLPIRVDGLGSGKVLQAQMSREELESSLTVALPEPTNQGPQESQGTGQDVQDRIMDYRFVASEHTINFQDALMQFKKTFGLGVRGAQSTFVWTLEAAEHQQSLISDMKEKLRTFQQRSSQMFQDLLKALEQLRNNCKTSVQTQKEDVQDRIMDYRFVASEHTINFQDALMQFKKTFGLGVRGAQSTFVWTLEAAEHQQSLISDMKEKLRTFQQRSSQMFQDLLKALEQLRNNCKTSVQTQKEIESVMKNSKMHVNFLNKDYRHTIVLLQEYEGWLKQQLTKVTHTSGQVEFDDKGQETNRLVRLTV
ncbi:hypothetical protein AHF37_00015 [Paragonimus kellicotti]|nr:hypothetical protein AHF37_00015 [Paragonimus kellicotti]